MMAKLYFNKCYPCGLRQKCPIKGKSITSFEFQPKGRAKLGVECDQCVHPFSRIDMDVACNARRGYISTNNNLFSYI